MTRPSKSPAASVQNKTRLVFAAHIDPHRANLLSAPPSSVGEIWLGEFDYLYHHFGQGILTITMHPQVIGRGHRLLFLERRIRHMAGYPGVTFTTIGDYVRRWRKGHKPELPRDVSSARSKAWEASAPAGSSQRFREGRNNRVANGAPTLTVTACRNAQFAGSFVTAMDASAERGQRRAPLGAGTSESHP
jgi:hypothetical protein